jgi:hypothetical protein
LRIVRAPPSTRSKTPWPQRTRGCFDGSRFARRRLVWRLSPSQCSHRSPQAVSSSSSSDLLSGTISAHSSVGFASFDFADRRAALAFIPERNCSNASALPHFFNLAASISLRRVHCSSGVRRPRRNRFGAKTFGNLGFFCSSRNVAKFSRAFAAVRASSEIWSEEYVELASRRRAAKARTQRAFISGVDFRASHAASLKPNASTP